MHNKRIIWQSLAAIAACIAIVASLTALIPGNIVVGKNNVAISLKTSTSYQATLPTDMTRTKQSWGYEYELLSGDKVEVGNKLVEAFEPRVRLNRWDKECYIDMILPYTGIANPVELDAFYNLGWSSDEADLKFYPYAGTENDYGGFEFDITIKEKPPTNTISAYFNYSNLEFHYQPPLTDEYKDGWSDEFQADIVVTPTEVRDAKTGDIYVSRPANVVGSYAVYKKDNSPFYSSQYEAEKYRTGKAFHWYRPLIWDSSAKPQYVWGDLQVDDELGIRAITIPRDFYDSANYPIIVDDNFGYEGEGGTSASCSPSIIFATTRAYTPGSAGTLDTTKTYCRRAASGANVQTGLYLDADGSKQDASDYVASPASVDWIINTMNGISISAVPYQLVINPGGTANTNLYYDDNGYASRYQSSASLPDTVSWTDLGANREYSIYAIFTPSGGGAAITNTQASWNIGIVDVDDVVYFSATGAQDDDYSQIENTGSVAVDVEIQGTDFEGGSYDWTLAASAGSETYSLYANSSNGTSTYDIEVKSSAYNDITTNLPVGAVYNWSMKLTAPTAGNPLDDGSPKSSTVTLVASATS